MVTAERRAGDVQRTPIAIQVVSGEALQNANVSRPVDLVNLVPGLAVSRGAGGMNSVYVRGIGAQILNAFGDMAVAQSIDGAYVARGTALSGAFLDVQRIEVLKGPQGTLYGRNATGGAINYITNRPEFRNGGQFDVQVGNYDDIEVKGVVNAAVNDKFALRGALGYIKHDGYLDTSGADDQKTLAGRLSALIKPSDRLTVYLSGDYSRDRGIGVGQVVLNTLAGNATASTSDPWQGPPLGFYAPANYNGLIQDPGAGCTLLPSANQCRPPNTVTFNPNQFGPGMAGWALNPDTVGKWAPVGQIHNHTWGLTAQIDADLGPATFTLLPNYRETLGRWINPAGGFLTDVNTPVKQHSLEARLASNGNGALKWLVGGYYFHETQKPAERYWNFNQVPGGLITNQGYIRRDYRMGDTSYAAFGQATYSVTEQFRVTAGARYTYEKKSLDGLFRIGQPAYTDIGGTPFCPVGVGGAFFNLPTSECTLSVDDTANWDAVNWKVGLEYDVGPRSMVYANVSTGFHAGGFNDGIDAPASSGFTYDNNYEPEKITAYAAGVKNRFLDNRLQLNAEVFYWDFKGKQNGALTVIFPPVVSFPILNVGDLKEYGADVEVNFLASRNDLLSASVSYLHTKYEHFVFTPTSQVDCAQVGTNPVLHIAIRDCAGKRVPNAPKWSATLSYEHTFRLVGADVVTGVRSHLQSRTDLTIGAPQFAHQDGYAITDLWVSYRSKGPWSVTAYVNNVGKTEAYNAAAQSFNSGDPTWWGNIMPPRTYGVRASVKY